jgi:hypothetical protein
MFSEKELNLEESILREQVAALSLEQQQHYRQLVDQARKNANTYGKLNLLCLIGVHHFYLQRWPRGGLNLVSTLGAVYLLSTASSPLIGLSVLVANIIIEVPQMLNIEHIVHAHNIRAMQQSLDRVRNSLP